MEVKNTKELKRALKEGKRPIIIKDKKFKAAVIRTARKQGRLYSYDGRKIPKKSILDMILPTPVAFAITEAKVITLVIIGAITIVTLYAIYKDYNIKVNINPDGSVELDYNNT